MKIFATGLAFRRSKADVDRKTFLHADLFEHFLWIVEHDLDHEVVRGGWNLGDPIPEADLFVVDLLSPMTWVTNKHALPIIDLMAQRDGPILFLHTDWQMGATFSGFKGLVTNPDRLIKKAEAGFFQNRDASPVDVDLVQRKYDDLYAACSAYVNAWKPNWTLLLHIFPFGSVDKLLRFFPGVDPNQRLGWDPSSFLTQHELVPPPDVDPILRRHEWVAATLSNPSKWIEKQGFTWPVTGFGRWAGRRVSEHEVVAEGAKVWGVLSPPHSGHVGSGLQRMRYVMAAMNGNVLYADPRDQVILGSPYQFAVGEFEAMTSYELKSVADGQREWLYGNVTPYAGLVGQVDDAVTYAYRGVASR